MRKSITQCDWDLRGVIHDISGLDFSDASSTSSDSDQPSAEDDGKDDSRHDTGRASVTGDSKGAESHDANLQNGRSKENAHIEDDSTVGVSTSLETPQGSACQHEEIRTHRGDGVEHSGTKAKTHYK
eukprot:CAMPEP_0185768128 /NCGR_PEP_ID=MMETSP1174-20130828/47679_1 /TAXON_ID=35687 /ORGANISM="Dictyocha speculum, Strain CCMP1381" /LENGTH=126 /DNA_ID=CAMNT_0028452687 /DNA_START=15 /DNA_END=395 /DNA_ORIENTATION=+